MCPRWPLCPLCARTQSPDDADITGKNITYMVADAFAYLILTFVLERAWSSPWIMARFEGKPHALERIQVHGA